MKLRRVTLKNVRRFTSPATIDGIGDGLNVLCAPNEHGKSTLFDAIQALFFKPHGSNDRDIKSLKPHAGGAPEVTIEVETVDGVFEIHKMWTTSKAAASVHQNGKLVAQADAAEAWIKDLLGTGSAAGTGTASGAGIGGPTGLIWVRQGLTGLTDGTAKEQSSALNARRDLMSSVSDEVEAMTGGRRMDAALARCKAELKPLVTSTGKMAKNGPWHVAFERVENLSAEIADLASTAAQLHDALAERKRKRRELADLTDPEIERTRKARLEAARAAHREAERHAEALDALAQKVAAARLAVSAAEAKIESLNAARREFESAETECAKAEIARNAAQTDCETARISRDELEGALKAAKENLKSAEEDQRRVQRQQIAREGRQRRRELSTRVNDAETTRKKMQDALAALTGPDPAALRDLENLYAAHRTVRATRDAMATQIRVRYEAQATAKIQLNGVALESDTSYPIARGASLRIVGVGQIDIQPGDQNYDDDAVAQAERTYETALADLQMPDITAARLAADARARAQEIYTEAKARLNGLAPDGIDALRDALAMIPLPDERDAELDVEDVARALETALDRLNTVQSQFEEAREWLGKTQATFAGTHARHAAAVDRLARARTLLDAHEDLSMEERSRELDRRKRDLQTAESAHAEVARATVDLSASEAALNRAGDVVHSAQDEIGQLRPELARLDERIARGFGDAVEERLAESELALVLAQADLDRIEREVAVLQRLERALNDASANARERYFTPIATELKPLLNVLWPDAQLTWGHDTLLPEALIRNGQIEPIDVLSGGTQEQLALLVRLAFARMLAKDGRHAPVVLDDALVFTDDDRIERMFNALHQQAGDLQIIVLSCRQRAFRELGGRKLHIVRDASAPI